MAPFLLWKQGDQITQDSLEFALQVRENSGLQTSFFKVTGATGLAPPSPPQKEGDRPVSFYPTEKDSILIAQRPPLNMNTLGFGFEHVDLGDCTTAQCPQEQSTTISR